MHRKYVPLDDAFRTKYKLMLPIVDRHMLYLIYPQEPDADLEAFVHNLIL